MIKKEVTIINKLGLHARAAAKLVNAAMAFNSEIILSKDEKSANAKSILSVMMLAAKQGTVLALSIDGQDEIAAQQAIEKLIERRFDEAE